MAKFFSLRNLGVTVFLFTGSLFLSAQSAEPYISEYWNQPEQSDRLEIMEMIIELDDPAMVSFLGEAAEQLETLLYKEPGRTDSYIICRQLELAAAAIGEAGDNEKATLLYRLFNSSVVCPEVRFQAAVAMGKVKALQYREQVGRKLDRINLAIRTDRGAAQREAAGCIECLRLMGVVPAVFPPLFYASIGWYNEDVRSAAYEALLGVEGGVRSAMIAVLKTAEYPSFMPAMELLQRSGLPAEEEAAVLRDLLQRIGDYPVYDDRDWAALQMVENRAIDRMKELEVYPDNAIVLAYRILIDEERGIDVRLKAADFLCLNGSDRAMTFLGYFLTRLNSRYSGGSGSINRDDFRLITRSLEGVLIKKNPVIRPVLEEMYGTSAYSGDLADKIRATLNEIAAD